MAPKGKAKAKGQAMAKPQDVQEPAAKRAKTTASSGSSSNTPHGDGRIKGHTVFFNGKFNKDMTKKNAQALAEASGALKVVTSLGGRGLVSAGVTLVVMCESDAKPYPEMHVAEPGPFAARLTRLSRDLRTVASFRSAPQLLEQSLYPATTPVLHATVPNRLAAPQLAQPRGLFASPPVQTAEPAHPALLQRALFGDPAATPGMQGHAR